MAKLSSWRRVAFGIATLFIVQQATNRADATDRRRYCPPAVMENCPPTVEQNAMPNVQPAPNAAPMDAPAPQAQAQAPAPAAEPNFDFEQSSALGGSMFAAASDGNYIDNPVPGTRFRLRYDSANGNNVPDRAEFFYAQCGCFPGSPGLGRVGVPETNINFQEATGLFEYGFAERWSTFVEVPFRFLDPAVNSYQEGISDINVGAKYALFSDECQILTLQFRTFIPTGDASSGLGTDHVSLEPALLYSRRLSDKVTLLGELRDWIAVGGTNFSGNVLRYGVGASYSLVESECFRLAPVAELVGWTVLDGRKFDATAPNATGDAAGDTIINAKLGVRATWNDHHSFGAGYGRALTGEVWYEEIFRVEYRFDF